MDINMLLQLIAGRGGTMWGGGSPSFRERGTQVQPGFTQQPTPAPTPVMPMQGQGNNFLQQLLGMSGGGGMRKPMGGMGGNSQLLSMLRGARPR